MTEMYCRREIFRHIFRVCAFNALQVTAMQTELNHCQTSEF